jgi:hypothetical protein
MKRIVPIRLSNTRVKWWWCWPENLKNKPARNTVVSSDADALVGFLTQPAENIGRNSKHTFEGAGEVELVAETGALGNLFDQRVGLLKPLGGKVHFEAQQKLVWALMVIALKQPAQIGGVHVAVLRNLTQRLEPLKMGLNVLPALLVSGEGQRLGSRQRRERAGDFQRQTFQKLRAQFRALPPAALPAADEFMPEKSAKYLTGGSAGSAAMSCRTPGP